MKKLVLAAMAAMLFTAHATQAQEINTADIEARITRAVEATKNPKKNTKAVTWIVNAKAHLDAATAATDKLFVGMDEQMVLLTIGDKTLESRGTEKINGETYNTFVFPFFTAYLKDGKLVAWKQTKEIYPNAIEIALESFNKAYELDGGKSSKSSEGVKAIVDFCSQEGNLDNTLGYNADAAEAFASAYAAQSSPASSEPANPELLYFAGYLLTIDGANNPASYVNGAKYLKESIEKGYTDEEGSIYYYLFHCYYGQKANDSAMLMNAKQALLDGNEKFPKNSLILDGLMQLYTSEDNVGDPSELVEKVDASLAADPTNADLWFGRGRIFFAMKDYDNSIESFKKVIELKPDLFDGHYYTGLFYTLKGDAANEELNSKQFSSNAEYDEELAKVNAIYTAAIPYFEQSLEITPKHKDAVEFLKSLTFRLRNEPGMMDKYNVYNELHKEVNGL